MLVSGYLTTRFDAETQKRVPSITGNAIAVAPDGMTRRNYVELGGFLAQTPELRGETTARARAGLGIGKEKFIPIVSFGDVATGMADGLKSGDGATFTGRLSNHSYQDRANANRLRWEIQVIANSFTLDHAKVPSRMLEGELTSKPSFTTNGKPRIAFTMATSGEDAGYPERDRVSITVIAFDKAAIALNEQNFTVGQSVVVDGKVTAREYDGKESLEVRPVSVHAHDVARDRDVAGDAAPAQREAPAYQQELERQDAEVAVTPQAVQLEPMPERSDAGKGAGAFIAAFNGAAIVNDPKGELFSPPTAELPKVTTIVERTEVPDPIVATVVGLDDDGRILAHIGRGMAVAIDMEACSRVPAAGEKVRFTRAGDQEIVDTLEVANAGLELAR